MTLSSSATNPIKVKQIQGERQISMAKGWKWYEGRSYRLWPRQVQKVSLYGRCKKCGHHLSQQFYPDYVGPFSVFCPAGDQRIDIWVDVPKREVRET